MASVEKPLIVIAGPTASGKTSLAVELAERFNGEIICADSRTVYRGMDIGTAKPSANEQSLVPHWGLDLVEPDEIFTAANFQRYAVQKINEIRSRGHVPFLVGGTGLYIDSIVFNYQFGPSADPETRQKLELMSLSKLHNYCAKNNIELPENNQNKRYVVRAIEQNGLNHKRNTEPIPNIVIVGIATGISVLRDRISKRSEQLFEDGVVEEATLLGKKYGWEVPAMTGNIYRLIKSYVAGEQTFDQIKQKNVFADRRLAKRQLTWLKRNPYIKWCSLSEAKSYIAGILVEYQ